MEKSKSPEEVGKAQRAKWLGDEIVQILTSPTPKKWIKERPIRGGGTARYVAGSHYNEKLNEAFGFLWSQEIREVRVDGDSVVSTVKISVEIPGARVTKEYPDGTREIIERPGFKIVKEQCGGAEIKRYAKTVIDKKSGITLHKAGDIIALGDDFKSAVTDAKKKAASEFGMFMDVYGDREDDGKGPDRDQLESLYSAGEAAGMNAEQTDEWVKNETGKAATDCEPVELMGLLPKLREIAESKE
jgi:hypothetical protein